MKVLKPFYYDEFECIGGKCKNSCCIGWQIFIDKKNFIRYKNVKGEFGKKLNKGIELNRKDKNEKAYGMMTLENNRCSFLNNKNYCDIYINKGEDYLCNTCKVYPRVITKNGPIYERGLNLSCPEVAKKLVECDESFDFYLEEEKLSPLDYHYIVELTYNEEMYNLLWEGRGLSIEIAQFREIKLWKRLVFIKLVEEKLQNLINSSQYSKGEETLRILRENVTNAEIIDSFDQVPKNNKKTLLIRDIFKKRLEDDSKDDFSELVKELNMIFEEMDENELIMYLEGTEKKFNKYLSKYEYILENYIVYKLYGNYMKTLTSKDLNREISLIILHYTIIKSLLLGRWKKNNESLDKEDIIHVLSSCSRQLDHDAKFNNRLHEYMKKNKKDTLEFLITLMSE